MRLQGSFSFVLLLLVACARSPEPSPPRASLVVDAGAHIAVPSSSTAGLSPAPAAVAALPAHGRTTTPATRCPPEKRAERLAARERAIHKGMDWMERYLATGEHLQEILGSAVSIFMDLAVPVRTESIRKRALTLARKYARVFHDELFRAGAPGSPVAHPGLEDVDDFHEGLWLLSEADVLELPKASMLAALKARFARFRNDDEAYGAEVSNLRALGEEPLYDSMLAAFAYDRVRALYPNEFGVRFGLADMLPYLWTRKYITLSEDDEDAILYNDHLMLATHVAYVLSEYTRVPLPKAWLGPLYDYIRREYPNAVKLADPEYVSEIVDVLRSTGLRASDDPIVCDGTTWMLERQKADGSWGDWEKEKDAYSAIHPTWTVVHALREPFPDETRPYAKRVREIVATARVRMAAPAK